MNLLCQCGNNKNYLECCGIYINGLQLPETPQQLMRSRYTAYTMANIDFIVKTMQGKPLIGFNVKEVASWARHVIWHKLEILKSSAPQSNQGFVEFKAYYTEANQGVILHEISEFKREQKQWFYVDGQIL